MKLWEYAVILLPRQRNGRTVEEGEIVVQPTTILAKDEDEARLIAGRSIPESFIAKLERLEICLRPF